MYNSHDMIPLSLEVYITLLPYSNNKRKKKLVSHIWQLIPNFTTRSCRVAEQIELISSVN